MTAAEAAPVMNLLGYSVAVMQQVLRYLSPVPARAMGRKESCVHLFARALANTDTVLNVVARFMPFPRIWLENNTEDYTTVKHIVIGQFFISPFRTWFEYSRYSGYSSLAVV